MSQSSFQPRPGGLEPARPRDESPPPGGGIFLRLGAGSGGGAAGIASVFEVLFTPSGEAAREEIQRQRRVGKQNPSATDPPEGEGSGAREGRVAGLGRPGTPYSGRIILDPLQD